MFCEQIRHGRGASFEIEEVEVGVSEFSTKKLLVISTKGTTG